ncbi:MAG TPA: helix-turn-helix domain-containing protein, partial [Dermatophilaceae bacterium]
MRTDVTGVGEVRPLRADARRNRDALLVVAAAQFAERGVEAPLEGIARDAGVGIGTLYRHFPSREAFIADVYRREV